MGIIWACREDQERERERERELRNSLAVKAEFSDVGASVRTTFCLSNGKHNLKHESFHQLSFAFFSLFFSLLLHSELFTSHSDVEIRENEAKSQSESCSEMCEICD